MSVEERKFLYKKPAKIKNYRLIISKENRETYGIDLADYTGSEQGSNRGYILVCIDYNSRFLMTAVLKNKDTKSIETALFDMFKEYGTPLRIHCDKESALIHSKLIKDNDIEVYHTEASEHNQSGGSPIAERVIQTIRGKLEQLRDVSTARGWKQHVKKVTDDYNNTIHRTIEMKPIDAFNLEDETPLNNIHKERILEHNENMKKVKTDKKLTEGVPVVVPRTKKTFEKGYTQTFSDKVLHIQRVLNTSPVTYLLSNGKFYYKEQLQFLTSDKVNILERKRIK